MSTDVSPNSESSGLSLAVRLGQESSGAWCELVELYGPLVESWCHRAGLPSAARADVAQEVFLSVHRGIAEFDVARPGATFRGWLWTITRNAIAQWRRRQSWLGRGGSAALRQLAEIAQPTDAGSPDDPTPTIEETTSLLRRALERVRPSVEPTTWEAFWETTVLGRPAPEVARRLGTTPAAVRKAKSRMLQRLRQQLGDRR